MKDPDESIRKASALMKMFRDPDWYDDMFPSFPRRKKELHETEEGVEEMGKELQLLINQQVEQALAQAKQDAEKKLIEAIRSVKAYSK